MKSIVSRLVSRLVPGSYARRRPSVPGVAGVLTVLAAAALAGCSSPQPGAIDYASTRTVKAPSLAVPPDLINESRTERAVPPVNGETSLTTYQAVVVPPDSGPAVLPPAPGINLQRDGTQRWLAVQSTTPEALWPELRKFWQEQGFLLTVDARDRRIMETDWKETHANLDLGIVRNTLSKAMDNMYVTGRRDRYRTRLESGPNGEVYIFVSQRGMAEALTGNNNDSSQWVDRPNDPGLEAVYLTRLMRALAQDRARASGQLASATRVPTDTPNAAAVADADAATNGAVTPPAAGGAAVVASSGQASAQSPATGSEVQLPEPYDRAWLRVGLALDRANFTVDDRNRDRGLYTIRYVDPAQLGTAGQSFWNQLFHGKKEKIAVPYMINVRALSETETRVAVVDAAGNLDNSRQANNIMGLLVDQLR